MCGRYTLRVSPAELAEIFETLRTIEWSSRYNIAPTQMVAAVRPAGEGNGRDLVLLKWGLIPVWADDPKIGSSLINARAETVATKPAFRTALKKRRCLIPADGFYEWQAVPGQKVKQPLFISLRDVPVFAFAGLYEQWTSTAGVAIESCAIITTEANELMREVHTRMPVIVDRSDYDLWLDRDRQDPQEVLPLLRPYPADSMQRVPVSTLVNSLRNDKPECISRMN
jgi:putative SOS response-associated peptidase YedK